MLTSLLISKPIRGRLVAVAGAALLAGRRDRGAEVLDGGRLLAAPEIEPGQLLVRGVVSAHDVSDELECRVLTGLIGAAGHVAVGWRLVGACVSERQTRGVGLVAEAWLGGNGGPGSNQQAADQD